MQATTQTHMESMADGQEVLNTSIGAMVDANNENNNLMQTYQLIMVAIQGTTMAIKLLELFIGKEKKKQLVTYVAEKASLVGSFLMRIATAAKVLMPNLAV